jgi:hypothetical protein
MKIPEPLSPAARRLLELGTVVEPATAEQNARMERALAPVFGRTNALADATEPSRAERIRWTGGGLGAELAAGPRATLRVLQRSLQHRLAAGGTQVALALGALTATAGASFWLGRASTPVVEQGDANLSRPAPPVLLEVAPAERASLPPPEPAHDVTEITASSPPPSEKVAPVAATDRVPEDAAARAPLGAAAGKSNARHRRDATNSRATLAMEIERMGRVEAALRGGQPARALEELERRRPEILVEQAAALRAVARCQSGVEGAALVAQEALRRWPSSPFRARIREACGL